MERMKLARRMKDVPPKYMCVAGFLVIILIWYCFSSDSYEDGPSIILTRDSSFVPPDPLKLLPGAKFVYYKCGPECKTQGLVDRMRGAIFSYLLSVALNRTFAMDINLPCFENVLQENEVPWQRARQLAEQTAWKEGEMFWELNHADSDRYSKLFSTYEPERQAAKTPVLRISQNVMAFHELALNPKLGQAVRREVGVKLARDVGYASSVRAVFWRLFKLTPPAEKIFGHLVPRGDKKIVESGDKKLSRGLVCAHLRQKELQTPCDSGCQTRVMSVMENHGRDWLDGSYYFVASDCPLVAPHLKDVCPNCRFLKSPGGELGHTAYSKRGRCEINERALLELLMLSRCDVLFMTLRSGFSNFPHFIRNNASQVKQYIDPWYTGA